MMYKIVSFLIIFISCISAMDDKGLPTWPQLEADINQKIYQQCDRNPLATVCLVVILIALQEPSINTRQSIKRAL